MARTSKRYIERKETQDQKVLYKAGIYTRLSSERHEEWREKSSSIETQVLCGKEYALKENIKVIQVYTDYEYSGTNFERPQFKEMMKDIRERRINCIIIRDLSRLGREYLEMGKLIAITKELADTLRKNSTIDWQKRESARANMRMKIKRLLKIHRYPPDGMDDAVQTVMMQCEMWADNQ